MKFYNIFSLACFVFFYACTTNTSNKEESVDLSKHLPTTVIKNTSTADSINSQQTTSMGSLQFEDTVHDFGVIKQGEVVEHTFNFTNNSNNPVLISYAKATCGCTVAEYPREMILPNDKKELKVTFNSEGKIGYNEKVMTIFTNAKPATYYVTIKAEVKK